MAEAFNNNLISPADAEKLLHAHDGDCALLYLWLAFTGNQDKERAAGELCMTMAQVENAFEKLSRMLRLSPAAGTDAPVEAVQKPSSPLPPEKPIPAPAEELPQYTVDEIDACFNADNAFRAVLDEAEQLLGKQLTRHDTSRLLGIYNHLGLPAEVIFVLLHYCADISRGNNGAERKPTMNFIERQAYAWANLGISTMEAAEEYAEKEKSLQSDLGRVKSLLEIYDRKLTPTESNNIKAWLSMGFSDDAIELAYHRTVDKTGKRSLPYMNSILLRWHEAGIHTAREVEAAEPSARPAPGRGNKSHGAHGPFVPTEF